jgi:hypothetical protein
MTQTSGITLAYIHIAIHCKLLPYNDTNIVTNFWHTIAIHYKLLP